MSRQPRAGTAGKPLTIRATDEERTLWAKAAKAGAQTLSDWLRDIANKESAWIPGAEAMGRADRARRRGNSRETAATPRRNPRRT